MVKVFFIGLDGGELSLIKKWKDDLPNMKKFLEKGVFGVLESTVPPVTSPAWNCMFTGKNPAKIGIFSWIVFDKENKPQVVNLTYQDSLSVWDILSSHNLKVGVMNVPSAYPPVKVNGFMVSGGLLTVLSKRLGYTFPSELGNELDKVLEGYEIVPLSDLNIAEMEDKYIEAFEKVHNKHSKALKYLLKKYPCDLFINVFFIVDSVQHYFWSHMDRNHPMHDPTKARKYKNTIKKFYKMIDLTIGEIMSEIQGDANFVLVSDHGFGPCYGSFSVTDWLKENGFLVLTHEDKVGSLFARSRARIIKFILSNVNPTVLEAALRIIPSHVLNLFTFRERRKKEHIKLLKNIDWSKTKAYQMGFGIFINKKTVRSTKEYEELRDKIIRMLYQIRDPKTRRKVITQVFKKEEIYRGKYLRTRAPDILYLTHFAQPGFLVGQPQITGHHRLNGTFMAFGPDIKKTGAELAKMKIYDITPTILHFFGIPIPKDFDGRVLKEIFDENSELARKPVVYQQTDEKELAERKKVFTHEDEEIIKERLKRLGYL